MKENRKNLILKIASLIISNETKDIWVVMLIGSSFQSDNCTNKKLTQTFIVSNAFSLEAGFKSFCNENLNENFIQQRQ